MRILGIEGPALRLAKQATSGTGWMSRVFAGREGVIIVDEPHEHLLVSDGGSAWDAVGLMYCFNFLPDLEARRKLRDRALKLVRPGGVVAAVSRACDCGQELAMRMVASGVPPAALGLSNLSNREIVGLQPQAGVFLTSVVTFAPTGSNDAMRFREFASDVRKSTVPPDLRFVPEHRFITRIVDIGLTWQRP